MYFNIMYGCKGHYVHTLEVAVMLPENVNDLLPGDFPIGQLNTVANEETGECVTYNV